MAAGGGGHGGTGIDGEAELVLVINRCLGIVPATACFVINNVSNQI